GEDAVCVGVFEADGSVGVDLLEVEVEGSFVAGVLEVEGSFGVLEVDKFAWELIFASIP
ncbi:hypothetical protein DFQ30_001096, partial [Apophysomyces sp. BC1015]